MIRNSTILLTCPVSALPPPQITWYKDGLEMKYSEMGDRFVWREGGRLLEIYQSTVDDTARYRCVARNLAGTSEKDIDIQVQGE